MRVRMKAAGPGALLATHWHYIYEVGEKLPDRMRRGFRTIRCLVGDRSRLRLDLADGYTGGDECVTVCVADHCCCCGCTGDALADPGVIRGLILDRVPQRMGLAEAVVEPSVRGGRCGEGAGFGHGRAISTREDVSPPSLV